MRLLLGFCKGKIAEIATSYLPRAVSVLEDFINDRLKLYICIVLSAASNSYLEPKRKYFCENRNSVCTQYCYEP